MVGCFGVTWWRRRDWTEAGVWPALHEQLLAHLRALDALDLDCCAVDGSHVRALKGGPRRPVPGRPRTSRLQAPPDLRRRRHPAGDRPHRRQPQRRHPAPAAARRRPADPRPPRPAPPPARAVRRPRLRPRRLPPSAARPQHHPTDRPPRRRPRLRAGQEALGGRARLRLAARLQTTPGPLRAPRSHRPRPGPAGLRPDLLPPTRRRFEMSSQPWRPVILLNPQVGAQKLSYPRPTVQACSPRVRSVSA